MPQPLNRTLWETQHCLRKYDLTSSEAPILDSTGTYNERSHQAHRNVTRLDVSRTAPLDPRHAAHVLEQCPINELLVHIDHEMSMPPGENIDEVDCDGNLTLDRLAPTIFRAWLVPSMGRPLHTPIALKKLDLFRINLQYAQSTWLVAIDFSRMEALYIDECQHAYKFFEAASARKQGMLRNVRELHVEFFRESDDGLTESLSRSLEHCLTSVFRSLRTLKIVLYWADRMPHVEALSAHKRTLQQLMIEVYDRWEIQLDYDVQKIEQLLAGMCVLDDLAIAIPIHWSAPVNAVEDVRLDAWVDSPGGEHLVRHWHTYLMDVR